MALLAWPRPLGVANIQRRADKRADKRPDTRSGGVPMHHFKRAASRLKWCIGSAFDTLVSINHCGFLSMHQRLVANRCIIPIELHWNDASVRHQLECHPSYLLEENTCKTRCLARANRPLICTLFREKMTIFCGKLSKSTFFCHVPTINGLADAMCTKFGQGSTQHTRRAPVDDRSHPIASGIYPRALPLLRNVLYDDICATPPGVL